MESSLRTGQQLLIEKCRERRDFVSFERAAEAIHRDQPLFIPPYPGTIAKFFSPKSAFRRRHGEIHGFIARRNGKPVGRIAAIINNTHNSFYNDRTGFFGFFDCIDDEEVAAALFRTAGDFLKERGMDRIRGPYNPTINDECGLLVEGFDSPTLIGLTWNPPYYQKLVEGLGFAHWVSNYGFRLPLSELSPPARLKPIAERVAKRSKVRLRLIELANLPVELEIIREVYDATLRGNSGFIPISAEDLAEGANELKAFAMRELIMIGEQDGQRAAVAISLPNINEHLARIRRTPYWLRPLHFLWLLKTKRLRTGRQVVYGVSPRFRDKGLHGWLTYEHFVYAKSVLDYAELGWIEEGNKEILLAAEIIGGQRYRKWTIYEKSLTDSDA
ncbi:MAG: hypothetical protein Fur0032_07260 [Terrimicrobiaceae bacterium]